VIDMQSVAARGDSGGEALTKPATRGAVTEQTGSRRKSRPNRSDGGSNKDGGSKKIEAKNTSQRSSKTTCAIS
jgi:hypothetical protein